MKHKDIWLFNKYSIFDEKLGLVYKDFQNDAFEIILCSTDYYNLSQEDIVIPLEESDLQYSIIAHSDMIFPLLKNDKNLNKKIGTVTDTAIEQIGLIRKDIDATKNSEIRFNVGGPIFYRSDKRYYMKLDNLELVNHFSEKAYQKLVLNIPDNVVVLGAYRSEKSVLEGIYESQSKDNFDLVIKQLLALHDRKLKIEDYLLEVQDGEFTNLSLDLEKMEVDIKKMYVAA